MLSNYFDAPQMESVDESPEWGEPEAWAADYDEFLDAVRG